MRYPPGTMLENGKYRIEGVTRETPLRVIHRATNVERGVTVAVHTLAGEERDILAEHGMMSEAMICARLEGAHSPQAFDLGRDGAATFLVTEPLEGWWLSDAIADRGPLGEAEAIRWLGQALDALCELHEMGWVHRDVKPANMVVVDRGPNAPRLLLCGLGLAFSPGSSQLREDGIHGTPAYMAPEQLRSPKVDARADVWSWGASLYEALSGRLPFVGRDLDALARAVAGTPHPPLAGVSDGVARLVDRCLAKDPNARFPSASALRDALRPLQAS